MCVKNRSSWGLDMRNGIENLRVPTSEEAREIGRKGGKASAKARQKKRTYQEIFRAILEMPARAYEDDDEAVKVAMAEAEKRGEIINEIEATALTFQAKARRQRDTSAAVFVRDSAGYKPVDNVDIQGGVNVFLKTTDEFK